MLGSAGICIRLEAGKAEGDETNKEEKNERKNMFL
jgi:hypothetical protein